MFNASGTNQTNFMLGKLRNTIGSTSRKFKFCNNNSPDLNYTFNCVFNNANIYNFNSYHILNDSELLLEDTENVNADKDYISKATSYGPYTPAQIKTAYSIPEIIPSDRSVIVTVISAYANPYLSGDIAKYGQIFNLPSCNFKIYNFSKTFNSSWAVETTLDVQMIYGINPYANIRIILAASSSNRDIFNAINFANNKNNFNPPIQTDIITMSFGMQDNGALSSYNRFFSNTKTIYIAASGDSSKVSFPSSCTNVIAIGGTSLTLDSSNKRTNETVWKYSGCGFSPSFSRPSYQPKLSNNNLRITPDLSCVADSNTPLYIVINKKLYSAGGTSASSPIYAAMLSLITQNRINTGKTTLTSVANKSNSIQPLLYNLNGSDCFYDVTKGKSGNYSAKTGFDIASGNGVLDTTKAIEMIG